jgi:D-sedoheptulose 7-phosphate isomerase
LEEVITKTEAYVKALNIALQEMNLINVDRAVNLVISKLTGGRRVFTCGNGGSGATASHYVNDWTKGLASLTTHKSRAFCLNDNTPLFSAIANDIGYKEVFSYQLEQLGEKDDLLVVVSGSGNSENIIQALLTAQQKGIQTIGVLGFDGGRALALVDEAFWVQSFDMQIVEDVHSSFGHLILKNV